MPKKLSNVIGIDVGSKQIKVAEVKVQGGEPVITALGIASTPPGTVDQSGIYDPDAVAAVLKEIMGSSGASAPFAVMSIAGQASVMVRTMEVPKMSASELKDHMAWEVQRNYPFAESTHTSDFKAFDQSDPTSQNMDVIMAVSPESAVQTVVSCVAKAGKKMFAVDVEPLALGRSTLASYGGETHNRTVCVVDIGHNVTSINIFKNGQLLMPRQVPIGGFQFTRAIADGLGMREDEAETLKCSRVSIPTDAAQAMVSHNPFGGGIETLGQYSSDPALVNPGLAVATPPPTANYSSSPYDDQNLPGEATGTYGTPESDHAQQVDETPPPMPVSAPVPVASDGEQIRYYNAFASTLDEFLSEIRRSIDFFKSKGGEVDAVMLCGGGAKLRGLPEFLTSTLGMDVTNYDPLKGISMNGKKMEHDVVEQHRQEFAVAVGNALHICYE